VSDPGVAVVVCTRDRPEQLHRCLVALADQPAAEVLVVDSASRRPDTVRVTTELCVRCVSVAEPGLALARNVGVRSTSAAVVAFTDDDCIAQPGWITAVAGAMSDRDVGVALGRVAARGSGAPMSVHLDATPRTLTAADDPSRAGHGANLAVRRSCWEALAGFDELLGVGGLLRAGEDVDFVWRALRAGWSGRYLPEAVVEHEQWRGRLGALRTSYGYGVGGGAVGVKVARLGGKKTGRVVGAGRMSVALRQAASDARHGYAFGVAVSAMRAAGIVVGRRQARRLALDDGRFHR